MEDNDKADLFGKIGNKLTEGIRNGTKLSGKAIAQGGILAEKASELGGKALKNGAEKIYDRIKLDKTRLKEIKEINAFCNSLAEILEDRKKYLECSLNKIVDDYTGIEAKTFALLDKYRLAVLALPEGTQREFVLRGVAAESNLKVDDNLSETLVANISKGIVNGVAVGAATGIGLAATVGAFGSASTGTALASLHGAAFTNALLATLGGGSLASGGMGLLGGVLVLGSGVLIPAAIVSAWIADGNIQKAYDEALNRKEKAKQIKSEATLLFNEYEDYINIFRHLLYEYEKFGDYFEKFLFILPAVAKTNLVKEYQKLLEEAVDIIIQLDTFVILDANGKVRTTLSEEFRTLVADIQSYKYKTAIFSYRLEQEKNIKLDTVIESYDKNFNKFSKEFPHLDDIAVGFLATSEVYRSYNEITRLGLLDQSAIVIGYAKSVEYSLLVLLKNKGFCPKKKKKLPLGEAYVKYFFKHKDSWPEPFLENLYQLKTIRNEAAHPNEGSTENAGDTARDILLGNGNYQGKGLLRFIDGMMSDGG